MEVTKSLKEWSINYLNEISSNENVGDDVDTITVDVPLFIRLLEYAREDAKTDMDLHDVTENILKLSKQNDTLTMDNYSDIVGGETDSEMNEAIQEPEIITQLRDIVDNGSAKVVKCPKSGKKMKVDLFSASAIVQVYDALNDANKQKFTSVGLLKMQQLAFKFVK